MIRLNKKNKGQSIMEFITVTTVIIAAFVAMQIYIKRGIQGRWKAAIDDLGDQYDPLAASSNFRYMLEATSNTVVFMQNTDGEIFTKREDKSISTEKKQGYLGSGPYNFFE